MLWDKAVPADIRIEELEKGSAMGETRITFSTQEIMESANLFADGMKEEALVLIPREGSLKDNLDLFNRIAKRAGETGAKVRVLGRFLKEETVLTKAFQAQDFQFRLLSPGRVTNVALGDLRQEGHGSPGVQVSRNAEARRTVIPYGGDFDAQGDGGRHRHHLRLALGGV